MGITKHLQSIFQTKKIKIQTQCLQLRFQTKKFKIQTKSGLILGKIRTISLKNLDSIKESRLFWIFKVKLTMNDLFKRFQKKPVSGVILLFFLKIQTFDKNPDQIWTSLVKKVRIQTKVWKSGPTWRQCLANLI